MPSNTIISCNTLFIEREIQRLLASYAHFLDDGKFADIAELMAHADYHVLSDTAEGRAEVEAYLNAGVQRHTDGTPRTWHSISNVLIDIDPDGERAASVSYFIVHQAIDGFPLQPICTGRYEDTFERHDGSWCFTSRIVRPRLFGDVSYHVMPARG